jgi:hypothetical protein
VTPVTITVKLADSTTTSSEPTTTVPTS